jgi:hypothetical protein
VDQKQKNAEIYFHKMLIRESEQCGKSELDLWTVPPTQTWMEEGNMKVKGNLLAKILILIISIFR